MGSFWVAIRRYRRELPSKGLSYFVASKGQTVRIHIWNSGNAPIEKEDYLSPVGFTFGHDAHIREAYVESQTPEDLGLNLGDEKGLDSGNLEIPQIYVNPNDKFAFRIVLADTEKLNNPKPYGRIRGTHQLFKETKARRLVGATERPSIQTYLLFVLVVFFAIATLISAVYALSYAQEATQQANERKLAQDMLQREQVQREVLNEELQQEEEEARLREKARLAEDEAMQQTASEP